MHPLHQPSLPPYGPFLRGLSKPLWVQFSLQACRFSIWRTSRQCELVYRGLCGRDVSLAHLIVSLLCWRLPVSFCVLPNATEIPPNRRRYMYLLQHCLCVYLLRFPAIASILRIYAQPVYSPSILWSCVCVHSRIHSYIHADGFSSISPH